ncbi:uracil-DNA glycosylase [Metabacillus malikii]|uniref:Uracil-DNA glycosylase n=1 Tax=Metabacillus malikii TaxID=1504265 RepID=A0ABT9ZGX9_9BACI|nr:uracil-DNA glycosylase [Metabacillus malikii]MDQ0230793.1 uracil-DNA glycosylase [Metabacillus malikii]
MEYILNKEWDELLTEEFKQPYFRELAAFLEAEYEKHTVFPQQDVIFNALNKTPYSSVKVVILGQDPYHGAGQAHGLSFSVQPDVKLPPSLRNIFLELQSDIGCSYPESGSLENWAKQGVLLLNTVLTVRQGEPNSHKGIGWERFTDNIISLLNSRSQPIVFILWGKHAGAKKTLITSKHHYVIESPHPSPFSARKGFFGSRPFSKTNVYLKQQQITGIDWAL